MAEKEPKSTGNENIENLMERLKDRESNWLKRGGLAYLLFSGVFTGEDKEKGSETLNPWKEIAKLVESLRGAKPESLGFGLITDGTLAGAISGSLAGWGMKELGDIWKKYGRENFPLDPFTERGRAAMKKQYHELKNALAQIGK